MEIVEFFYDKNLSDNPEIAFELRMSMEHGLNVLLKAPTGSGKTVLASEVSHKIMKDEKSILAKYLKTENQ